MNVGTLTAKVRSGNLTAVEVRRKGGMHVPEYWDRRSELFVKSDAAFHSLLRPRAITTFQLKP
jgi:hypothetical protein